MASELFVIFDKGDSWEITGTMIVPDRFEFSEDGVFDISNNKELFTYVKNRLKTHQIWFPKDFDGNLIKEDLTEIPYDTTEISRQRYITQGKEYLNSRIGIPEIFGFVEFIMLNNYFIEKGYVITDKNRHEKYLEIVETGDMELIGKLEDYLESRDIISFKYNWYMVYKNFLEKTNKAKSTEEMKEIWKEYIQTFE